MLDPDWLAAAAAQLDRLDGREVRKKRATIIALVDAHLAGRTESTVWEPRRPETCSKTIYDTKWKKEPVFASVLAAVDKLATDYRDGEELRALLTARRRLALASPVAVARLVALLQSGDEAIVARASTAILDRAGVETATKGSAVLSGDVTVRSAAELSDDDLANIAAGSGG